MIEFFNNKYEIVKGEKYFDKELVEKRIHTLNPKAQIFYISAKKDEGFEPWINYLKEKMKEWEGK